MDNHVSLGQHMCPVCGKESDSGEVLIARKYHTDPRTKQLAPLHPLKRKTTTGWALCEEHQKVIDAGYVIMIEAANPGPGSKLKIEEADRTGELMYIRKEVAARMFDVPIDELGFIDTEAFAKVKAMAERNGVLVTEH